MGCPSMSQARKPCWITFGTGSGLRAKFIKDLELKRDYSKFAETPSDCNPPKHRRLLIFALRGLDSPDCCAVSVHHGPENRIADHRRVENAQQRSHRGSEPICRSHDGLD